MDYVYDKKKLALDTEHFKGHARIKFDKVLTGKHESHAYTVSYEGKMKTKDERPHSSSARLVVSHNDGTPYSHKLDGKVSKDIKAVLKHGAPTFVPLSSLEPR